ncbi:MAG TPA: HD domain-containing phosphohydrolase [Acidisarcina sp.]|nr:HD domain-containing phosphohydrolase [Acidisarcina sp.]
MTAVRILVVDDDADVRKSIGAALKAADYQPLLAASSSDALHHIEKEDPFDLVLSDITLKGVDGLGLLDRLKDREPDTPVVIISAIHDIGMAITAMRRGAYDYLLKPFENALLHKTVRQALDYRRLVKQNSEVRENLQQLISSRTEMLGQAVADLERSYDITLEALGDALDLKDSETEGHSKRVTAFTIALARALGLGPSEIRVIARGAFLHDIGKMAIPDAILLKPGRLSAEEQAIMREHCARGYHILHKIPFLHDAAEIVYSHQEHFDGSGYPRGLKGEEIPLGARVFAIADALDAITSDRPYRCANSFEAARREIRRCAGTQFDPAIVETYLSLPDQLWQDLRAEIRHHNQRYAPLTYSE